MQWAVSGDQSVVGHGDYASAWIAPRFAEGIQLLEIDLAHASLFFQLALCCLLQRLILMDKTAGNRHASFERSHATADQQHLQSRLADRKNHDLNGYANSHDVPCPTNYSFCPPPP